MSAQEDEIVEDADVATDDETADEVVEDEPVSCYISLLPHIRLSALRSVCDHPCSQAASTF